MGLLAVANTVPMRTRSWDFGDTANEAVHRSDVLVHQPRRHRSEEQRRPPAAVVLCQQGLPQAVVDPAEGMGVDPHPHQGIVGGCGGPHMVPSTGQVGGG